MYRTSSLILHRIAGHAAHLFVASVLSISSLSYAQEVDASDILLQQAKAYEAAADYPGAVAAYREYLQQPAAKSAERRQARLKFPVLQEAVNHGAGPELQQYLAAMNLRNQGESHEADSQLHMLIESYPGSSLSDDAWYLRAYIALMDHYDYERANELLQTLRSQYPDSRYIDTALFAEAISLEQLGDNDAAIAKMTELRERHTGISVAGINWARDEYVSRLWFDRSNNRIEYLENRAASATRLLSLSPHNADGYQWLAELSVGQQQMTLLLNENEVINNITTTGSHAKVNAYAGIVMGQPESWARITIDNPSIRGMISVYGERHNLVPITSGGSLSDFHTLLLGDADGNVSDEPDHVLIPPKSDDLLNNYLRNVRAVSDSKLTPGEVSQVAMIGVVIDSKYNDYHGGRGTTEALSILNTTDGVFREQLGIALKVNTLVVIDDRENDPMNLGSVTMEKMMRNFKDYRIASNDLGSDIGLATLFSGNKNNDSALGLAWIGSACRTDGFDVSVVTPYKMPSLLSTHEIGHTMGAPHDSDTSCSSQNQHIMWPFLSSNSGRSFSSCSQESIANTMASNNCHVDAIDLSIDLENINDTSVQLSITNQDTQRATPSAVVTLSGPAAGNATSTESCRQVDENTLECTIGALSPMQSADVQFDFPVALSDTAEVIATVHGSGFIDVATQNNSIKSDINGNLTKFAGPINSDPITISSGGSVSSSNKSIASAEGGGKFQPTVILMLAVAFAARRRFRNH